MNQDAGMIFSECSRLSEERLVPLVFSLGDVAGVGFPGVAVALLP